MAESILLALPMIAFLLCGGLFLIFALILLILLFVSLFSGLRELHLTLWRLVTFRGLKRPTAHINEGGLTRAVED